MNVHSEIQHTNMTRWRGEMTPTKHQYVILDYKKSEGGRESNIP